MILVIDNYDSFTYNLVQYIGEVCQSREEIQVYRNDQLTSEEVLNKNPSHIVMSPGPCTPNEAGICLELSRLVVDKIPLLGVCLGHQAIVQAFGGNVVKAKQVLHGKSSPVLHTGDKLFNDITSPFIAARYHSLIVERDSIPNCFNIIAESEEGVVMAVRHSVKLAVGVQFHPESILSPNGKQVLKNFFSEG